MTRRALSAWLLLTGGLVAQAQGGEAWSLGEVSCAVHAPAGHRPERFVPVAVVFAGDGASAEQADAVARAIASKGVLAVVPHLGDVRPDGVRRMFAGLRRKVRIEQGGMHAVVTGDPSRFVPFVLEHRVEFQSVTVRQDTAESALQALRRLPARRIEVVVDEAERIAERVAHLHSGRQLAGVARTVAQVLDDFHDAAAVGDEARYFAILPDDALFLGTDGTERWTGTQFRAFAMPYFERDSAWTYVCLQRFVDVEPDGDVAIFDETFDNAAYGECRGSGVLARRGDRWVLRQYHLTVPVPNDVSREVAARIRAFQDQAVSPRTTIVLVRHAEKTGPDADELSDAGKQRAERLAAALRDLKVDAVYTSTKARTGQTVAPLCAARGVQPQAWTGSQGALASRLRGSSAGCVLVCGHSNTVPELLAQLGVRAKVTIADDEYDRLFVVTLGLDGAQLVALRY
ncbi:MAG: nuclear transport factor 2 family protein [Planctomycetes bacterium]|nr:nuclear transport factor 2 family protein [Planctomycetota bacterium]